MEVLIRSFRIDDLPRVKKFTVEAFEGVSIDRKIQELFGVMNDRDWKWRKGKHLDEDVAREPEGLFVAEIGGVVVGFISTWHDAEAGMGNIPNLAVDAEYRGHGIGRKLIQHALAHFRRLGLKAARIETLAHNEVGKKLYPSFGFREVARQIHYCMSLED